MTRGFGVAGRRSGSSLYHYRLATYDAQDPVDQSLAKGSVHLWGLPSRIAARRDSRLGGASGSAPAVAPGA